MQVTALPADIFLSPAPQNLSFISKSGFVNWKKALLKYSGFKLHSKSEQHSNAMYAWAEYQRGIQSNKTMLDSLNERRKQQIVENKKYIKTIAEVLLLTVTQNIAQRGHREDDNSNNRGNFLARLDQIANHDPFIKKRLDAHGNPKYTSHQIQNEILQGFACTVQKQIITEVKAGKVCSILVDETKGTNFSGGAILLQCYCT